MKIDHIDLEKDILIVAEIGNNHEARRGIIHWQRK